MLCSGAEAETLVAALQHGAHAGVRPGPSARGFGADAIGETGIHGSGPEGPLCGVAGAQKLRILGGMEAFDLLRRVNDQPRPVGLRLLGALRSKGDQDVLAEDGAVDFDPGRILSGARRLRLNHLDPGPAPGVDSREGRVEVAGPNRCPDLGLERQIPGVVEPGRIPTGRTGLGGVGVPGLTDLVVDQRPRGPSRGTGGTQRWD